MVRMDRGGWFELFRRDAARWVQPGQWVDPPSVDPRTMVVLLLRHPPLRAMAWMRFGGWLRTRRVRGGPSWVQRRILRLYGLEVQPGAQIGGGCYIAHPSGCVIRPQRIGDDATIIAAVTIGLNKEPIWPTIGDRVFLGAGCRVLGDITLGDDVRVGANAVVLTDVPDDTTMVGIPARPVGSRGGESTP